MRKIVKSRRQPRKWTEYCCTPGVDYQASPELREILLKEQGFICAYCMKGLDAEGKNTKIEHMKCRRLHPDLKFKYRNMVVCCNGDTFGFRHCDTSKGDEDISFDLLSDPFFTTLTYGLGSGVIKSTNTTWNDEINDKLNLNNEYLKHERLNILHTVIEYIGKHKEWNQDKNELTRLRNKWDQKDTRGRYNPYCGIIVYFLTERIKRCDI